MNDTTACPMCGEFWYRKDQRRIVLEVNDWAVKWNAVDCDGNKVGTWFSCTLKHWMRHCVKEGVLPLDRDATIAQLRQQLAEAVRERDAYRSVLDSIHRGWDCDSDAHKYGTECRCCAAEEVLNEFKPKETTP